MKILTLAGGSAFGIVASYFLSLIERSQLKKIDLFAGTSIGSILAASYANGIEPKQMHQTLVTSLDSIFSYKNFILSRKPEFDDKILNETLKLIFKDDLKMKDLKQSLVIPAFNLSEYKPKVFESFDQQDGEELVWEVCRKSCSAPSYLLPYEGYIDGGIFANNPSLIAICTAISKLHEKMEDIEVLSIGCGSVNKSISGDEMERYFRWDWLKPMISSTVKCNMVATDYTCKQLPLKKYTMYNPVKLNNEWSFVDPSHTDKILQRCESYKEEFKQVFEEFIK